ncbi:MAG: class II glutamine amidotransferase [Streptosporangiaceae bacterium]|nr:class II glutamine amidotransferase [Streptosporangiaceae bacterium]
MCRLLGYCARRTTSLAGIIGEEGLRDFTALSAFHSDGWGMAWADGRPGGPIQVRKSPLRASGDPAYAELARQRLARLGIVHLRWATPGLAVGTENSHPFCLRNVAMAHNGAIHPQDRLPELLPPDWERLATGGTDSERYFLHVVCRLEAGGDMLTAIGETAASITARFAVNSLNAVLLTPTALYAVCCHDRSMIPSARLRSRGYPGSAAEIACHFDLAYRQTADAVVVASSDWPQDPRDGWTTLPNGHVLMVAGDTLQTKIYPLPVPASLSEAP